MSLYLRLVLVSCEAFNRDDEPRPVSGHERKQSDASRFDTLRPQRGSSFHLLPTALAAGDPCWLPAFVVIAD